MNQLKDFLNDEMDDDAMEKFTEDIIFQKFDQEKRQVWSKLLKDDYNLDRNKQATKKVKLFTIGRVLAAAAAIALLIGAFFLIDRTTLPTDQALAQSYVDDLPIMADQLVFRKGDNRQDEIRILANEAYIKEDFNTAVKYWTELVNNKSATDYDLFYLGISHLKEGSPKPQKAITFLLEAQASRPDLQHEINWLLSLAYVRSGQKEKARPILESIVAEQKYMAEPAANLLKVLKD